MSESKSQLERYMLERLVHPDIARLLPKDFCIETLTGEVIYRPNADAENATQRILLRGENGLPFGFACGTPVGELSEKVGRLENEVKLLRGHMERCGIVPWEFDISSGEILFDSSAEQFFNCKASFLPRNVQDLLARIEPQFRQSLAVALDNLTNEVSETFSCEIRLPNPLLASRVHAISMYGALERDEQGRIVKINGTICENSREHALSVIQKTSLDNLPDVFVFAKDEDYRFTYANQTLLDALGKQPKEVIGMRDEDIFGKTPAVEDYRSSDRRILFTKKVQILGGWIQVRENKIQIESETFVGQGGEVFEIATIKIPIEMPDGSIQILGIANSIAKMRQLGFELFEKEALIFHLMESAEDVIFMKCIQGKFMKANKAMARLAGVVSPDFLVGKTDYDFFHSLQADAWRVEEQMILKTGKARTNSLWVNMRTSPYTVRLVSKFPCRDTYGKIIGILGISKDVTDLDFFPRAIDLNASELESCLAHIPQFVFIKDTVGRYRACNPQFANRHGFNTNEIYQKTDFDLWPREVASVIFANDQLLLERKQANLCYRETLVGTNGTRHDLVTSKIPLFDQDGNIVGLIGMYEDVTSRIFKPGYSEEEVQDRMTKSLRDLQKIVCDRILMPE